MEHTNIGGMTMKLKDGISLQVIQTDKFKDISICLRFMSSLDEKQATIRSLLTLMMGDRSEKYDTKKKMSKQLDSLFGASCNIQTIGYGASQVLDLRCKIIHPAYALDTDLLQDTFAFLSELIFHPLLSQEVFDESKEILRAKLKRMHDEPSQYAVSRALQIGGEATPLAISALGDLDVLENCTLENVKQAYDDLLHKNRIDILICGDVQEGSLRDLCVKYFPFKARNAKFETCYKVHNDKREEYKEEYRSISQSNIMMLWFTNTEVQEEDYYPLRVANAIFGQYPTSYLFQEVREKNSLCYSVYSNLISFDGALGVMTGVEKGNIDKAVDLIKKQFKRVCDGDFDDELIEVSKTMMINSLLATKDSMASLISLAYQNAVLDQKDSVDDIVSKVTSVKRDDLIRAMNKCELKLTFILTKEADENAEAA